MKFKQTTFNLILFFIANAVYSQDIIYIQNPSFEANQDINESKTDTTYSLRGWLDLGFPNCTPVNIHYKNDNRFKVRKTPNHGDFFIGLVTRVDTTYERVFQELSQPLIKNTKYNFSIHICTSKKMVAAILHKSGEVKVNQKINNGAILRIQGSNSETKACEVLAETTLIENEEWEKLDFILEPQADYDILILEAFYDLTKSKNPFCNANILLDNCSHIIEVVK